MTVHIPGFSTLTGKPVTILRLMREARFFADVQSDEEYIELMQQSAWRIFNVNLDVEGSTIDQRAESLLRSMADNGLIKLAE